MLCKFLVALLLACAGGLCAQSYSVSSGALGTYPVLSGATTLSLSGDDLSAPISPSGFSFNYFGSYYSSFQVGTNGYIVLGGNGVTTATGPDYATAPGLVIAPCWANLDYPNLPQYPSGTIRWRMVQGVLQVEWNNMALTGGAAVHIPPQSLDMVLNLDTASGVIEFDYGFPGASTVGVTSQTPYTAAIASASGSGQEIIAASDPGYINTDGSMPTWPKYRRVIFTPAGGQNSAPTLAVSANGSPVGSGDTLNVALNSALSALGLSIDVGDPDGDMVLVNASVSNVGATGIDETEFGSTAAATPYSLHPASGTFNVAGATHTVVLSAGDGRGGVTNMSFNILVGGAQANNSPQVSVTVGGAAVTDGATINVTAGQTLASLNLVISVDDPENDATSLAGTVGNVSSEGILDAEFSSATAGVPYTLSPTTGAFSRPQVTLPVTLTASDGISPPVQLSFQLSVGSLGGSVSGVGGGGGGGGCAGSDAAYGPLLLALLCLAGVFHIRYRRRRAIRN